MALDVTWQSDRPEKIVIFLLSLESSACHLQVVTDRCGDAMFSEETDLHEIADAFDANWNRRLVPSLDAYLAMVGQSDRLQLARLLVPIEIEYRLRHGESVDPDGDYRHLGSEIIDLARQELA